MLSSRSGFGSWLRRDPRSRRPVMLLVWIDVRGIGGAVKHRADSARLVEGERFHRGLRRTRAVCRPSTSTSLRLAFVAAGDGWAGSDANLDRAPAAELSFTTAVVANGCPYAVQPVPPKRRPANSAHPPGCGETIQYLAGVGLS